MTYVIKAIDSDGKSWFRNSNGSWQEKRDSQCHYSTLVAVSKTHAAAITANRYLPASDRMESITVETLL